jgi:uncharacterized protein (UPF0332 family)
MTFSWEDYLKLARQILPGTFGDIYEAKLRTAVSRAYYAAFNTATEYLNQAVPAFNYEPETSHKQVWLTFSDLAGGEKVRENGLRIKRLRTRADYHADPPVKVSDAELSIERAEKVIENIRDLRSRPSCS